MTGEITPVRILGGHIVRPEPLRADLDGQASLSAQIGRPAPLDPGLAFVEGPPGPTGRQGDPGIAGPRGERGPTGYATGFGYASYGPTEVLWRQALTQGQRARLAFDADPAVTIDALEPPFQGHAFWDGGLIRPLSLDDTCLLRIDLRVRPLMVDARILVEVDIGEPFGVIQSDRHVTMCDGGATEDATFAFPVYERAAFLANGGAVFLTSSVDAALERVRLVVFPLSFRP